MSLCGSKKLTADEVKSKERSKIIERDLQKEVVLEKRHMKLLLLGTGDAGKSTFAKQMSLIHNKGGLSEQYTATFIPSLRENALYGMQNLLRYLRDTGDKVDASLTQAVQVVLNSVELTLEAAEAITVIWQNKEFQEAAALKGEEAQLAGGVSGVKYYFEHANRFADKDYKPTTTDLLIARRKTTGIVETRFTVGNSQFTMVDVGGQRSERKKWLHCFGSVSAVIYLTAINEYDMALEEDTRTNRLVESLKLWKALTSSQFFQKTPFILFLNKSDLFADKLQRTPLIDIFSDYETFIADAAYKDLPDFEKSWKYISKQYYAHYAGELTFYPHLTCALDTEQCRIVFNVVQDTILKENLEMFQL